MQVTSPKIIQKTPVLSSLTGREMNLICYAYECKVNDYCLNSGCALK